MPLVLAKVEGFLRCFPGAAHLRDDFVSVGFIGLVYAVNKIANGKGPRNTDVDAPVGFISMWINRELRRLVESETTIRVPHESSRLAKQRGEILTPPCISDTLHDRSVGPVGVEEVDVCDVMDSCCTGEEERIMLRMREAKSTWAEIVQVIGQPQTTLYKQWCKLYDRIAAKLKSLR
jgi:hypothetical protein